MEHSIVADTLVLAIVSLISWSLVKKFGEQMCVSFTDVNASYYVPVTHLIKLHSIYQAQQHIVNSDPRNNEDSIPTG